MRHLSDKIVDDASLKNICRQAKAEGKTIVSTSGCFDLLHAGHVKYLEQAKPDLILLDIQMAQKNGIETLREIRAMENRADIPVIMLTGVEDKDFVLESAKLGICDYILKPFHSNDLLKRIHRVFEPKEQN